MAKTININNRPVEKERPALTPEARESYIISLAMDMAEEQIKNRTASSQVLTHFLKAASAKYQLELEEIRMKNELAKAKTEQINKSEDKNQFYQEVMNQLRGYRGDADLNEEDELY